MSCLLATSACAALPPCNREDVTPAYDAHGVRIHDAVTLTGPCMQRIIGDLKACYKEGQP